MWRHSKGFVYIFTINNFEKHQLEENSCWNQLFKDLVDNDYNKIVHYSYRKYGYSLMRFQKDEANEHFEKHCVEIMKTLGYSSYGIKEYLVDANNVIHTGIYIPELNAYVQVIGGVGQYARCAFVGVDRLHERITTFHIKK